MCREEELLEELDDRIESFQAKIEYNDQQIVAIATPSMQNASGSADGDNDADGVGQSMAVDTPVEDLDGDGDG